MSRKEIRRERIQNTLNFIEIYQAQHGYSPSIRDIQEALSVKSTNTVFEDLKTLEQEGKIIITRNKTRSISLPGQDRSLTGAMSTLKAHCERMDHCSNCSLNENGCKIKRLTNEK